MKHPASPRVVALVGPQGVGKTTLLAALLHAAGGGGGGGRGPPRAPAREVGVGCAEYLGEQWTFLDCPGAPEFVLEARHALAVCDAALVVCDGQAERAAALAPLFSFLDARHIPHLLFLNVLDAGGQDAAGALLPELLDALQGASSRPLVMRELPLRQGEQLVGVVDLVSERTWSPEAEGRTARVPLPDAERPREEAARRQLLERLADVDDALLEQLLEDEVPAPDAVYGGLERALREDRMVPVFLGSAARGVGLQRLLKGLRHEVPPVEQTRARLALGGAPGSGAPGSGAPGSEEGVLVQAFRTQHLAHVGKQSRVRVWRGELADGDPLAGSRVSGLLRPAGSRASGPARAGEVVVLGRVEGLRTGDVADAQRLQRAADWPAPPPPMHEVAIAAEKRTDDVKLMAALAKLVDEDPSLHVDQDPDSQVLLLGGQGELHLREALEHLRTELRVPVVTRPPPVPYRESVRREGQHHARYKRQSGGHGQFGDVVVSVAPLPRGAGITFRSAIVGGVIPKQYIPAVEEGVREGLRRGPLGFPVVDVAITLVGGTYHSVDSSDQAFRTTGRLAMVELLPRLEPVLLEPILHVELLVPRAATPGAQRLVTGRRGQILGLEGHPEVPGWDLLAAYVPQAELPGFIVELRSASAGLGSFVRRHDHYAERVGKSAGRVLSQQPPAGA